MKEPNDKFKFTLNNSTVIDIQPTEVIVLTINFDSISFDQCEYIYESLLEKFPDNEIVVLPDKCSLGTMSKQQINDWIDNIKKGIE